MFRTRHSRRSQNRRLALEPLNDRLMMNADPGPEADTAVSDAADAVAEYWAQQEQGDPDARQNTTEGGFDEVDAADLDAMVRAITEFRHEQAESNPDGGCEEPSGPSELSGDMRQRVLVARALIDEPDLLIMDEATSALQNSLVVWMQQVLSNIWQATQQAAANVAVGDEVEKNEEDNTTAATASEEEDDDDDSSTANGGGGGVSQQPATTVQLPTFAFTTVTTTVSVPDGGTVLLGGIKRMAEGRNEQGVPMLSKLPYINRLFKNVGVGRDTSTLMLMVTPRIIIQEEEEVQ